MNRQRHCLTRLCQWVSQSRNISSDLQNSEINLLHLRKNFNLNDNVAEYLSIKHPIITKIDDSTVKALIRTVHELGYPKDVLIENPVLFAVLPITIKFRHQVLTECGFINVSPNLIASYLTVIKQKCISDLKESGLMPSVLNIENRLASCMTQWPTSLTSSLLGDTNQLTLYSLRLKILQRYFELMLDISSQEFSRGIITYPTIKHRPLAVINETLTILQSQLMMPAHKIKSNFYLLHGDPENLRNIIYKFRSIGGIDIKEIIRRHPKIAMKSYNALVETRKIFKEYKINDEAQRRCFEIYSLSSSTVKERLEKTKSIPEFETFTNHPRFLKMIYYNKTAIKRLHKLYRINKQCVSLNILSGSSSHYEVYEKAPGDRLGKCNDLVFCLSQLLGKKYKNNEIRNAIKRHPFWINIPLLQVKYVFEQLSKEFAPDEIYENCPILLYPWNKITAALRKFDRELIPFKTLNSHESLDTRSLSKSQKLSLVLYALERDHYFTGNGVWTEEKIKTIVPC